MKTEPEIVAALYKELWKAPLRDFPTFRERINAPEQGGVYIIFDEWGQVFYVGMTTSGLARRLGAHMRGRRNKRRRRLGGFSFLVVNDSRHRSLLEAYATDVLHPLHLGGGWVGIG